MILAGDVGGTKVALALHEDDLAPPVREAVFPSRAFASLEVVVAAFAPGAIARACFAVAGPVAHGAARMPNVPWILDERVLAAALHAADVTLINDLVATPTSSRSSTRRASRSCTPARRRSRPRPSP